MRTMKARRAALLATWFGCGYAPIAPGTVGSLGALIPAWALSNFADWPVWIWPVAAVVVTAPGIWAADVTARRAGAKDPSLVVVDEVVGQWMTLAGAHGFKTLAGIHGFNWKTAVAAFLLFRIFDIWKPAPVRQLEALPGGLGIMADDLMAGVYGAIVLWVAGVIIPGSLQ